jgi:O-antigen/teichoic acid export membrane protein
MSLVDPQSIEASPIQPALAPLRKRLISAGLWSLIGRFGAILLFFLTDMVLARALSKPEFGAFYLVTQATVFLGTLASLGTPQILSRSIRQTLHGPHPERTPQVIRTCSQLLSFGCLGTSLAFLVLAPYVGDEGPQWAPFREARLAIVAWACLGSACLNAAFTLQALDDFRLATVVGSRRGGVLPNVLFLTFALASWGAGFINTATLIYAQAIFQALTLWVAVRAIRGRLNRLLPHADPKRGLAGVNNGGARPDTALWYLGQGLPFLATMLVSMAVDELDGLWVGRLVSEEATADYGAAKRLVRLMTVPFVMFGLSLAPFVAELLAKNEKAKLERIMRAAATLVSLPMLVAFAAFMFAPRLVLSLAFGDAFREAAPVLQWLTVGPVLIVMAGHGTQVLLMAGRQKTLMLCSLTALAVYGAALYPAVERFGTAGAAAVQSIVFAALGCSVTLLARKQVGVWTMVTLRPANIAAALRALRGTDPTRQTAADGQGR